MTKGGRCKLLCKYGLVGAIVTQVVIALAYVQFGAHPIAKGGVQAKPDFTRQPKSTGVVFRNHSSSSDRPVPSPWPPMGLEDYEPMTQTFFTKDHHILIDDDMAKYFLQISEHVTCMKFGVIEATKLSSQCVCKPGWYGSHCSIPESVQSSDSFRKSNHKNPILTLTPKRVINAFSFNRDWNMLEARMHEIGSLVDIFIIQESNYTLYGDPKQLLLLRRLREGYLKEFHHKIMYVFLDHFPQDGRENGWVAENYGRNYLFKAGVQRIKGLSSRDLFMYTDADEVPSFEAMLFLKFHEEYGEPIGFKYNWAAYGFFWTHKKLFTSTSVCSVKFLQDVADNDVPSLRGEQYKKKANWKQLEHKADMWYIGSEKAKGGWHCSWCFPPVDIRNKLMSAINGDFPRWGDYPEKRELPYIRKIIKTGTWFNDKTMDTRNVSYISDPSIMPRFIGKNAEYFRRIVDLKYAGDD